MLKITGKARIADWFVSFEAGKMHWHAELVNATGKTIGWKLKDGDVFSVRGFSKAVYDGIEYETRKSMYQNCSCELLTLFIRILSINPESALSRHETSASTT